MIARQELEADLGALDLGASSNSLISALHKLSPDHAPATHWTTRLIFGAFHPSPAIREATIRKGSLPEKAKFQAKSFAWAYSLFVVGYVFHVAQTIDLKASRSPANISHLVGTPDGRKVK
jgi:hypothetical protein